jgi:ribosomal protein L40E
MTNQYWICTECNESYARKPAECRRCRHTVFRESDTEPDSAGERSNSTGESGGIDVRDVLGRRLQSFRGYLEPLFSRRFRPYLMGVLLALFILVVVVLLLQL